VVAEKIEVLNKAPLPFHLDENPGEDVRLKYRYLDLRRPDMQRKMRTRTALVSACATTWTRVASRTSRRRS
jgi:aspartyl-tRNA synthetase